MPCTIPSLCLFSSIFFFLQKSLLLYFCLLKLLSCQGPEQTQACLCSLSRAFPVSTDCPCGLCSLEQDATVCLSFALDRHTDTQTHRLAHPQAQYTCTYIGIAHTHTHTQKYTPNISTLRAVIVFYFSGVSNTHKMPWTVKVFNNQKCDKMDTNPFSIDKRSFL